MTPARPHFPVAVIGCSGRDADGLIEITNSDGIDPSAAYLVFADSPPDNFGQFLQENAKLPVVEIVNNIELQPGHIYLLPENTTLTVKDNAFVLLRLTRGDVNGTPLDECFTSVAKVCNEYAMGILLSGSGHDGILGLKKIREAGGAAIVENPNHAKSKVRLQDAIESGVPDYILEPAEIPGKLTAIHHSYSACGVFDEHSLPPADTGIFAQILWLVFVRTGTDFRRYDGRFFRQRIAYRMALAGIGKLSDYLPMLKADKREQEKLYDAFLPTQCDFFQNDEMRGAMDETVFPAVLSNHEKKTLRIWTIGCATGEEAYSVAIMAQEYLSAKGIAPKVQVFASDVSAKGIESARAGVYMAHDVAKIPRKIREAYFNKKGTRYHINTEIRQMCVFSVHDVLKDPPFSKIDLIVCNNVAKYLGPALEEKLFSILHYALTASGLLVTDADNESLSNFFDPVEGAAFCYSPRTIVRAGLKSDVLERIARVPGFESALVKKTANPAALFLSYAPAGVIADKNGDIIHFNGDTSPFLQPANGKPNFNIFRMSRTFVELGLKKALDNAIQSRKSATEAISTQNGNIITVEAIPVDDVFLILFRELQLPAEKVVEDTEKWSEIEHEMKRWRHDILSVMEERETAFEELQTTHEELISSSEEMQMLNEELECATENLRSANEELSTLNDELLNRQQQVTAQRNYSDSIISTIREPLAVIDKNLSIHRVNPAFCRYLGIHEDEAVGQSLENLVQFDCEETTPLLAKVLSHNLAVENRDLEATFPVVGKRSMTFNAGRITGSNPPLALIAFNDITDKVAAIKMLENRKRELELYNQELHAFGSAANHDMQEPLRKTLMFAKRTLLDDKQLTDASRHSLERIVVSMTHMQKLVGDSINYMRSNLVFPKLKGNDLGVIVKRSLSELDDIIAARNATVIVGPLPEAKILPDQARQLFTSLIMNAISYNRDGLDPQVFIKMNKVKPGEIEAIDGSEDQYIKISITDNGQGFDESHADRIFHPFFRLHSKDNIPGSGLGLTLCKKIMANHKGFIKAAGKMNVGCTVDLYFERS